MVVLLTGPSLQTLIVLPVSFPIFVHVQPSLSTCHVQHPYKTVGVTMASNTLTHVRSLQPNVSVYVTAREMRPLWNVCESLFAQSSGILRSIDPHVSTTPIMPPKTVELTKAYWLTRQEFLKTVSEAQWRQAIRTLETRTGMDGEKQVNDRGHHCTWMIECCGEHVPMFLSQNETEMSASC